MKIETTHLFVYGTLLASAQNVFSSYLLQNSKPIGTGTFQGELYVIDWFPGVKKSNNPEDIVHGHVVELLGSPSKVLAHLDEYEDVSNPPHESDQYVREEVKIHIEGNEIPCWIYIYQGSVEGLDRIESGDFIQYQKDHKS